MGKLVLITSLFRTFKNSVVMPKITDFLVTKKETLEANSQTTREPEGFSINYFDSNGSPKDAIQTREIKSVNIKKLADDNEEKVDLPEAFPCSLCYFVAKKAAFLKAHMLTHSDER
jgi:hypothetical protein